MPENVPPEIAEKIVKLKNQFYSKGSIVRSIQKQSGSKEQAQEYIRVVTKSVKQDETDNPGLIRDRAKKELLTGISAIVLGIAIATVLSFGFAIFLGGVIYTVIGLYHEMKYRAKKK